MTTDYRALCAELAQQFDDALDFTVSSETRLYNKALVARTRTALAAEPVGGPSAADDSRLGDAHFLSRAADLLAQRHPAPVPVSERLQQMEDLAADAVSGLRYIEQSYGLLYGVGWDRVYEKADRLLPAHALPLPAGEVQP